MKKAAAVGLIVALCLFLIPMGFLHEKKQAEGGAPDQPAVLPDSGHTVTVLHQGQVTETDLNEYLWGVVAAEMPASFQQEALNAQAVAARTYALRKAGHAAAHPDADLCTDYACCQAWIAKADAQANWGENAAAYTDKITRAVAETNDQVVLYEGQLIDAVFHSSSSEATQDAVAVWGNDVAYLKSVSSPESQEEVPNYSSSVTLTAQECRDKVLASYPEAVLEGDPTGWFSEPVRTAGGSVGTLEIGGVTLTGVQARTLFGLRSADFTVETTPEGVTFHVTGYGHGVGMSQYGANTMAAQGSTYTEILQHYYTGVTVEDYTG